LFFIAILLFVTDLNTSNISTLAAWTGGNIFLIGFMGSGKSHWGKIWSEANQWSFIDLDEMIENKEGQSIASIFEHKGEEYFRNIEAMALRSCDGLENSIIACGGGTPCFYENMQWMNDHGSTIYLASNASEILQRVLAEIDKRPLLKKLSQGELLSFIEQKLTEREPYYTQANLTVQSARLNINSFPAILSAITS
jgi:shikimate kinase